MKPQIVQHAPKLRSKIVPRKCRAQFSVSGRLGSNFEPHQSLKVRVSLERSAHFHMFARLPVFGRQGSKSFKIEPKNVTPNLLKCAHIPMLDSLCFALCLASIWDKNNSKKRPPPKKVCKSTFERSGGHFFTCVFVGPQGSLSGLNFVGHLVNMLSPKSSNLQPHGSYACSFRFCKFKTCFTNRSDP